MPVWSSRGRKGEVWGGGVLGRNGCEPSCREPRSYEFTDPRGKNRERRSKSFKKSISSFRMNPFKDPRTPQNDKERNMSRHTRQEQ